MKLYTKPKEITPDPGSYAGTNILNFGKDVRSFNIVKPKG